jgi:hypothetical protein
MKIDRDWSPTYVFRRDSRKKGKTVYINTEARINPYPANVENMVSS